MLVSLKKIKKIIFTLLLFIFPLNVFAYQDDMINLYLFHGDGCPHCADEIEFLNSISEEYSNNLNIVKYEVWHNDENAKLLDKVWDAFSINRRGVPTTVIGNTIFTGYGPNSGNSIKRAINFYLENEYSDVVSQIIDGTFVKEEEKGEDEFVKQEAKSDKELTVDVPVFGKTNLKKMSIGFASVLIGLIDGFNPCAMWVLLFLISLLIGMKDRKKMWILGLTFLATSALVYMFIMLSWISIAVKITTINWIRIIIALVALIGGVINLYSFIKGLKSNGGCDVVDEGKRKKIFTKIKKAVNNKSFIMAIIGIMALAVSVNLVELACSAGLPVVFSELLAINNIGGMGRIFYTLIYIFFFLLDDLIIFFIAMFTMNVTGISTKYNNVSHLIGGLIMIIVGVLLIFNPGILMFN